MMSLIGREVVVGEDPSSGGDGHDKDVEASRHFSIMCEPARSVVGWDDAYSVETDSTGVGDGSAPSSDGGSVHSDHARDCYEGDDARSTDDDEPPILAAK